MSVGEKHDPKPLKLQLFKKLFKVIKGLDKLTQYSNPLSLYIGIDCISKVEMQ